MRWTIGSCYFVWAVLLIAWRSLAGPVELRIKDPGGAVVFGNDTAIRLSGANDTLTLQGSLKVIGNLFVRGNLSTSQIADLTQALNQLEQRIAILEARICPAPNRPVVWQRRHSFGLGDNVNLWTTAIGDLNGDGFKDVVTADNDHAQIAFMRNLGRGNLSFSEPEWFLSDFEFSPETWWMQLRDLDNDGLDDLLFADNRNLRLFKNLGNWQMNSTGMVIEFPAPSSSFILADFDLDGDLDIASTGPFTTYRENIRFIRHANGTVIANPALTPSDVEFAPYVTVSEGQGRWYLAYADFNGDGNLDLAALSDHDLVWWPNQPTQSPPFGSERSAISYSENQFYPVLFLAAGDVDRDSAADLLICGANVLLVRNNGAAANFGFAAPVQLVAFRTDEYWHCEIKDLDRDGWPEIIVSQYLSPGRVSYLQNDGTGHFPGSPIIIAEEPSLFPGVMSIADFDRDGDQDFVFPVVNPPTAIQVFENKLCQSYPEP